MTKMPDNYDDGITPKGSALWKARTKTENIKDTTSQITHSVMLFKKGVVDEDFNKFVDIFLIRLKGAKMVRGEDIRIIKEKCIRRTSDATTFEYGYPYSSLSDEQRKVMNSAKKEIQSIIKEKNLQNNIMIFGKYQYVLKVDKPIDVQEKIFEMNQLINGISVDINDTNMPPFFNRKFVVEAANKAMPFSWELCPSWCYTFETLDNTFYKNIKRLSDYLFKNKLLDSPLDINDIQRRYSDGLKEASVAGIKDNKKRIRYFFGLTMKRIKPEEFMKIQDEFFKTLSISDYTNTSSITFTTNADGLLIGYSCYIAIPKKDVK
jgi:hypothetical protein